MFRTLILVLLAVAPLWAAEGYQITPYGGVGKLKRAPYLPARVRVVRNDPQQAVTARMVARLEDYGRSGTPEGKGEYSVDFTMAAGVSETVVLLNMPFSGYGLNAVIELQRRDSGGAWVTEATAPLNESPMNPDVKVVGFLSTSRLEAISDFLADFALLEIPELEMASDWRALLAYDAILVNTERLTRDQYDALVEYVSAGGTLMISPKTAASFNPGQPAAELLGIPSNVQSREETLGAYGYLLAELKPGYSAASQLNNAYGYPMATPMPRRRPMPPANTPSAVPANVPGEGEEHGEPGAASPPVRTLVAPPTDSRFTLWPDAGRARAANLAGSLISVARVGAGLVVFIRTDISRPPFTVSASDDSPSLAGANLMIAAFRAANARGLGRTPLNVICAQNGSQLVDIAGHRIPGNATMIVAAFLYILAAGMGVFFLARKLKRPELYPAGLLVFGVLSVAGVFTLGNWFKRAGERVNAVRLIVADGSTDRAGSFSLGCAYVPSGGDYEFRSSAHGSLVAAELKIQGSRGMPNDLVAARVRTSGSETVTMLSDLMQFQNVLFVAQEPLKGRNFKFSVSGSEGALVIANEGEHALRGCIVLVGKVNPSGGAAIWHYVPTLDASGGKATLTASTTTINTIGELRARLDSDLGANSLEFRSLMTLLRRVNSYSDSRPAHELEGALLDAGLMPASGEVLVIAVAPPAALSVQSLGTPEEPDDIRQSCILCVRCVIP